MKLQILSICPEFSRTCLETTNLTSTEFQLTSLYPILTLFRLQYTCWLTSLGFLLCHTDDSFSPQPSESHSLSLPESESLNSTATLLARILATSCRPFTPLSTSCRCSFFSTLRSFIPSRIAFNKSFLGSARGGPSLPNTLSLTGVSLGGLANALIKSPLTIGPAGGAWMLVVGIGGGGGGGGAAGAAGGLATPADWLT